MRSEIVGSSGERPTVNEAVEAFSVFLATQISHSICASQVSSYIVRLVRETVLQIAKSCQRPGFRSSLIKVSR
jgi:hypothetical protein